MSWDTYNCGHGRTLENTRMVGSPGRKIAICRLCQRVRQKAYYDRQPRSTRMTIGKKIALGIIR